MFYFFTTILRAGVPFGILMGIFNSFAYGSQFGIPAGFVSGALFGSIMALVAQFQARKFTQNRPLLSDEKLIKEGPANHQSKMEAAGGWIYFTNSRLLYVSHKGNISNHELAIPLSEIASVEKGKTVGFVRNQLKVNLKNGKVERFVVDGANRWISEIEKALK